jgi:Arc/MetJ family transcription regulator
MKLKVDLKDELVAEAVRASGITDLQELIREALQILIARNRRKSLLDLQGRIEFAPGYDPKQFR